MEMVIKMAIPSARIREILRPRAHKDFLKFMSGQTVEMDRNGRSVIFEDDFLRWVKKQQVID